MADDGRTPARATGRRARLAVFVDAKDWHARRLEAAFAARGFEAVCVSLARAAFDHGRPLGLALPGFGGRAPVGAFVRTVAGGSFEQVTRRLGVLHALRAQGVPVCNDARAIECCVDKSMTSFLLRRAGIATPATWACESPEQALEIVRRESGRGRGLVLKPLFGSQGRGLRLIGQADDLPPPADVDGVYYLQRYIAAEPGEWRDWRVLMAGGRAVAAMVRHGVNWITNVHQGASPKSARPDKRLEALAAAAAAAVGAGYAGVDIVRDRQGRFLVLEVNSMPAWSGLQKVSRVDITQALADAFLATLATPRPQPEAPAPRSAAGSP